MPTPMGANPIGAGHSFLNVEWTLWKFDKKIGKIDK